MAQFTAKANSSVIRNVENYDFLSIPSISCIIETELVTVVVVGLVPGHHISLSGVHSLQHTLPSHCHTSHHPCCQIHTEIKHWEKLSSVKVCSNLKYTFEPNLKPMSNSYSNQSMIWQMTVLWWIIKYLLIFLNSLQTSRKLCIIMNSYSTSY